MPNGKFICFEAIDGAGKTTTAARLADRLRQQGQNAEFLPRKGSDTGNSELTARLEILADFIWGYGTAPVEQFGDEHVLFNLASWLSAVDNVMLRPRLAMGKTVVMDNWRYKFESRMSLKCELDPGLITTCFEHISVPDHVIFLDVPPEIAAARKSSFTRGECGAFDEECDASRQSFVKYQTKVRDKLYQMAKANCWSIIEVGEIDVETVVARCISSIS